MVGILRGEVGQGATRYAADTDSVRWCSFSAMASKGGANFWPKTPTKMNKKKRWKTEEGLAISEIARKSEWKNAQKEIMEIVGESFSEEQYFFNKKKKNKN